MKLRSLLLLALLSGCPNNFVEPWEVAKPRIMLAKVVIDGDEEGRARPRAGESFSIALYLMSPERPQALYTGDMSTCLGTVLPNGTLGCAGELSFAEIATAPYEGDDLLVFTGFVVPPILDALPAPLDTLERVSLFGSLCVDGRVERIRGKDVSRDPISTLWRCTDNDEAEFPTQMPFTLSVWLDRETEGSENHHPSFACDERAQRGDSHEGVMLDGEQVPGAIVLRLPEKRAGEGPRTSEWQPWDPSIELPWDHCDEGPESLPRARVGDGAYEVFVRFDPTDRETYQRTIKVNTRFETETRREQLVLSHALTTLGGSLDGFTSVVRDDEDDSEAQASVKYRPPARKDKKQKSDPVPPEGRLVRFYFGLRDQRGGVDFTTRELCLLPPEEPAAAAPDD